MIFDKQCEISRARARFGFGKIKQLNSLQAGPFVDETQTPKHQTYYLHGPLDSRYVRHEMLHNCRFLISPQLCLHRHVQ